MTKTIKFILSRSIFLLTFLIFSGFCVQAQTISYISPNNTIVGGPSFLLTVTGSGFNPTSNIEMNTFPGSSSYPILTTTYINSTTLTAVIPYSYISTAGASNVRVYTSSPQSYSNYVTFSILNPSPILSSVSPNNVTVGYTGAVTINGTGFTNTSQAQIGPSSGAGPWTNLSTTLIGGSLTVSGFNSFGSNNYRIRVVNPAPGGGTSTIPFSISNNPPVIYGLSPNNAFAGNIISSLSIIGTGFNANTTIQLVDGASCPAYAPCSLPNFGISGSGDLLTSIPAQYTAQVGNLSITITNPPPGGGTSSPAIFSVLYPSPIITSITPSVVPIGSTSVSVMITGAYFLQSLSSVIVDGSNTVASNYFSSTSMQAIIPASYVLNNGIHTIRVSNAPPAGGNSATFNLTVGSNITSVTPNAIPLMTPTSPPQIVSITGNGFTSASQVYASGQVVPTTFVSATNLTATISHSLVQSQQLGAFSLGVKTGNISSSFGELKVGNPGVNRGTIGVVPYDYQNTPGGVAHIRIEDIPANAAYTLIVAPAGLYPYIVPSLNQTVAVNSLQAVPLIDGLGIFGPPTPGAISALNLGASGQKGYIDINVGPTPNPPVGLPLTIQVIYQDPTKPLGVGVSWYTTVVW